MLVGTKKHIKTTCSASEIIAIYFVKIHSSVNILDFWKKRFFWLKCDSHDFWRFQLPENVIFCSTGIFKFPLRTTQNQNFAKILWGSLENVLNFPKNIFGFFRPLNRSEIDVLEKNQKFRNISPLTFLREKNFDLGGLIFWSLR